MKNFDIHRELYQLYQLDKCHICASTRGGDITPQQLRLFGGSSWRNLGEMSGRRVNGSTYGVYEWPLSMRDLRA